ncbi:MAG: hypothetical protein R3E84_19310 [Pseudomonadales bacterium]
MSPGCPHRRWPRSAKTAKPPGNVPRQHWLASPGRAAARYPCPEPAPAGRSTGAHCRRRHAVHLDRKKDTIVSAAENVYPREVGDVLHQHPDVAEAAVFGVPDDHWGERVTAAIVARPGRQFTAAALDSLCGGELAGCTRLRQRSFVTEISKNVSGRILKRELRARFGA